MFPELKAKATMQQNEIQQIMELALEQCPDYNFDESLVKIKDATDTVKKLQGSAAKEAVEVATALEGSLQGLETWMDTVLTPDYEGNVDSITSFSGDWTLENLDNLDIKTLADKKLGSALKGVIFAQYNLNYGMVWSTLYYIIIIFIYIIL